MTNIAVKKTKTLFDYIKNNTIEVVPILHRSGVYTLKCNECDKIYLGKTGCRFERRLAEHARGEGDRVTNSLYGNRT